MITILLAKTKDIEILALLGRITYHESHSCFITDKEDLSNYLQNAFSISKTTEELNNKNNLFYTIMKYLLV